MSIDWSRWKLAVCELCGKRFGHVWSGDVRICKRCRATVDSCRLDHERLVLESKEKGFPECRCPACGALLYGSGIEYVPPERDDLWKRHMMEREKRQAQYEAETKGTFDFHRWLDDSDAMKAREAVKRIPPMKPVVQTVAGVRIIDVGDD